MDPPVRVMGLHSLVYCERLHYLEEVEEVRLADASMYAGRSLHERWEAADPAEVEIRGLELTSEELGLTGRLDAARTRDGLLVPYEHKRGRAVRNADGSAEAWDTDVMQVTAYAMLLEEHVGRSVPEARIRYHTDNVTVRIPTTTERRSAVDAAVARAKELRSLTARPPVNENSRKCAACSLAPVCLPEEERAFGVRPAIRLFPEVDDRQFLHVVSQGARVQRAGERLKVTLDGAVIAEAPVRSVAGVVLHGNAQITTQAIHLCADQEIGVHWLTTGGRYVSGLASGAGSVQRRLRQYEALSDAGMCLELARRLAMNRVQSQLRFLLRATRGA
ncbi:MAG: CRISPR-associated protein Cas4, partial [Dehalococcoidia bacterium]